MPDFIAQTNPFSVNPISDGIQDDARIVALPDGGFVIVWEDAASVFSQVFVMMQRYDALGTPVGENVRINMAVGPGNVNKDPQVALLDDGCWVVVWHHFDFYSFPQANSVWAQVYDADGNRKGDQFEVVLDTTAKPAEPSVTALENGEFLVAWQVVGILGGWATEMRAQKCDFDGAVGPQIIFETESNNFKNKPIVTALSDGQIALVWTEATELKLSSVTETKVVAQIITEDGQPVGSEFEVFADRGQRNVSDVMALSDGHFAVVGTGSPLGGLSTSFVVQTFSNDGILTDDLFIKPTEGEHVSNPQLSALPDGGHALTYSVLLEDTVTSEEQTDTYIIRFNAWGRQTTDPVLVNAPSDLGYRNADSDVAVLADGGVVVAWEGVDLLTSDGGIFARIYDADMYGTNYWDHLTGTDFDDRIFGLGFNDILSGGAGDDLLVGGRSDDILKGGIGDDILNGGGGYDEFHFSSGKDRIVRFDDNRDRIVLDGAELGIAGFSASEVIDTFGSMVGDIAVFDFGEGNVLTVNRVADLGIFVDDLIIG